MRVRRRRRILGAVLVIAYFAAFAWLTLPLWRPADAATPERTPVHQVKSRGLVGLAPLAEPKPLPASLPGSASTSEPSESGVEESGVEESGAEEAFAGGEVEATSTPETSEAPPSTSSSGSGSSSETIIGGEG